MRARRPGSARAVWLIARLSLRRQLNMLHTSRRGRSSHADSSGPSAVPRTAVAPKSRLLSAFGVLMLLAMGFNLFFVASTGVQRLATVSESTAAAPSARNDRSQSSRQAEAAWVAADAWPKTEAAGHVFTRLLMIVMLLGIVFLMSASLGLNPRNLGEVDWNLEWLYTFPAPARVFFAAKLFVHTFLSPVAWVFFLPLTTSVYLAAGYRTSSLLLGLAAMLYLSLLAGAAAMCLEFYLRRWLSFDQLRNVQAAFTIAGTAAFLLLFAMLMTGSVDELLIASTAALPAWIEWNPISTILLIGSPLASGEHRIFAVVVTAAFAASASAAALLVCEWLTRDGLVHTAGPSRFQRSDAWAEKRTGLRGIVAVEALLLARDRNLFVQVIIVPLAIPAFYFLTDPSLLTGVTSDFRNAAAISFALGAYTYIGSTMPILSREHRTLWLLLTFPRSLVWLLARKTAIWAGVGMLLGAAVLVITSVTGGRFSLLPAIVALFGIAAHAYIAASIGILFTNVTEPRARGIPVSAIYLYMLLAAMFASVIYSPSMWVKVTQMGLSVVLAFALWRRVADIAPYLLDPVAQPPRLVTMADGTIAVVAFFVGSQALAAALFPSEKVTNFELLLPKLLAGSLVVAVATIAFWRRKLPDIWAQIGVRARSVKQPLAKTFGVALALGGAAGLIGVAWRWTQGTFVGQLFVAPVDAVIITAALPVIEEFIFRGLLLDPLRRIVGPRFAVLGSAVIFAIVHPPAEAVPAFALGLAAGLAMQNSGRLISAVMTHSVYETMLMFVYPA